MFVQVSISNFGWKLDKGWEAINLPHHLFFTSKKCVDHIDEKVGEPRQPIREEIKVVELYEHKMHGQCFKRYPYSKLGVIA